MGNEASRLDGSPQGIAGGAAAARGGSSSRLPTTPISTPNARRAKSFSSFQPMSPSPSSSSTGSVNGVNGPSTPRAAAAHQQNLQRQQSQPQVERTIQRMDKAIRKRVRGGITYNMKIIIRGDKGTGKSSLFHRLKGEPIPSEHETTPQLQSATINWNFRTNSEENVKCEVWDVVDRGFNPLTDGSDGSGANGTDGAEASGNPFELGSLQSNSNFASVRASAAVAASIAGAGGANGSHTVATVDASTVDVYHETHGAIFLLDVTKWHTLEYVRQQLEKVPVHIPTLVLGNFRDCGNQRKIFKEDIQDLLYGNSDRSRQQQQLRRPHELLYFECSLLNCYGLKSLHQYFGIPFLQLKLATIRQQMRIVEGEFSHLKNDLQAKISEQRYSDYVEHIKSTGSDIRTGRKVPGGSPPPMQRMESTIVVNGSQSRGTSNGDIRGEQNGREAAGRSHSTASNGSDIVVLNEQSGGDGAAQQSTETPTSEAASVASSETERQASEPLQKDLDDLPERTNSLADQLTASLKFTHSESLSSLKEEEEEQSSPVEAVAKEKSEADQAAPASKKAVKIKALQSAVKKPAASAKSSPVKADEPVSLEDFQVPKQKNNDLDSFYSDDDSDANGDSDEDVIIPPSAAMAKKYSHKQQFIYSDSSDSDDEKTRRKAKKNSPRRRGGAKATHDRDAAPEPSSIGQNTAQSVTSDVKPSDASSSAVSSTPVPVTEENAVESSCEHQPQPPSSPVNAQASPKTKPVSPAARTSRSPSPRQKLESSRSHSPKLLTQDKVDHASPSKVDSGGKEKKEALAASESREAEVQEVAAIDRAASVVSTPKSPSGHSSPRRRVQPIRSAPSPTQRAAEEDSDGGIPAPVAATEEHVTAAASSSADDERELGEHANGVVESISDNDAMNVPVANGTISAIAEAVQAANLNALGSDLGYAEDDDHVVLSDGMDNFFSDEEDEKSVSGEALQVVIEAEEQVQAQSEPVFLVQKAVLKRPEMLLSDDEADAEASEVTQFSAVKMGDASVKLHDNADDTEMEFTVPISGKSRGEDTFFSDSNEENDDEEVKADANTTTPVVTIPVKAPSPPAKASRLNRRPDMLKSDDESESEQEAINPPVVVSRAVRPNRRPEMLMSDEDSDASIGKPATTNLSTMPQSGYTTQASSMLSSPADMRFAPPSPVKNNDLESFFDESDSGGDDAGSSLGSSRASSMLPSPPAQRAKASKTPTRRAVVVSDDDDDDEEESADRFSSYNAKAKRKSKAERKQEREEIRRMTASLSSSSLTIEDLAPVATTVGSTASADVLAAIRLAQEEALRMLPPSDGGGNASDTEKKSRHKKKSSSSSSSSRSKLSEDGTSTRKKKKSSSSSSSKASSSSRSSRRRDADSSDERRESRR